MLLELFHVGADEHLAQLDEVAVLFVVHLDDAPRIAAAADLAPVGIGDFVIGTNNSEGDLGHDLVVLRDRLLVIKLVTRPLKDLDLVVLDIGEDLKQAVSTTSRSGSSNGKAYSCFEGSNLLIGEGVSLGNDRNQVDLGMKALHNLDIQRLQRVTGGLDEEHTGMNAVVNDVHAVDLVLGIEISVKTLLDVVDNRPPRLIVVDEVAKAWSVNYRQTKTYSRLLNIRADRLDRDRLGDDVKAGPLALLRWVQGSIEEGVDESRLSETRFTCKMRRALEGCLAILSDIFDSPTTMTLKLKPFRTLLRCHWLGRLANPT
jgi:hypothetical protein